MKSTKYDIQNKKLGFTLVEMIVSIGIFTIVMLIATSAIFTVVAANNRAQSLKLVMDNLDFALQSMTREIRVGNGYSSSGSGSCPSEGSPSFSFTSSDSGTPRISYSLSGNEIVESNSSWDNSGALVPITASNINITCLNFYLVNTASVQPRVLITIGGTAGTGTASSTFDIQTTVSERQTGP